VQHHDDSLATFVAAAATDGSCEAVIVQGSVARGVARPDSDIDLYLLVSDDAFDAARRDGRLSFTSRDGITYDGGYFDIKLVTLDYLDQAADHGDEACRASFDGARVAWSRVDGLEARLAAIVELPEAEWAERQARFLAMARLHGWYFVPQGHQLGDPFLLRYGAVHLVMGAGRALLARNHVMLKAPKYLASTVAGLADQPDGYAELVAAVLADPDPASAAALVAALDGMGDWPLPFEATLSRFVEDNELGWLTGVMPPEYS